MYLENSILKDRQYCLKDILLDENAPAITMRNYNIRFEDREPWHKCARIVYKVMRGIYVSVIFYFVPFMFLFMEFIIPSPEE
jgi:hypothetical protein